MTNHPIQRSTNPSRSAHVESLAIGTRHMHPPLTPPARRRHIVRHPRRCRRRASRPDPSGSPSAARSSEHARLTQKRYSAVKFQSRISGPFGPGTGHQAGMTSRPLGVAAALKRRYGWGLQHADGDEPGPLPTHGSAGGGQTSRLPVMNKSTGSVCLLTRVKTVGPGR